MNIRNPIPKSNIWATPTLEDLYRGLEALPAKDKALVYNYVMMTFNVCNALVKEELDKAAELAV